MGWDAHRDSRDSASRWNELFRVMFMVIVLSVGMAKQRRSTDMPSSSVRVAWQSGSWMILRKLTASATMISCAVSQSTSRDGQLCQWHPERSVGSPQLGCHSAAPRCRRDHPMRSAGGMSDKLRRMRSRPSVTANRGRLGSRRQSVLAQRTEFLTRCCGYVRSMRLQGGIWLA